MRMSFKQLKSLSVETASGASLGRVIDAILELDGQLIAQYVVRPSRISPKELLISRDQIIRFEQNKIVITDTTMPVTEEGRENIRNVTPEPIAMRETGN